MPVPPKRAKKGGIGRKPKAKAHSKPKPLTKPKSSPPCSPTKANPQRAAAVAASMAIAKEASDDKLDGAFFPFGEPAQRVYIAMVWQFNFGGLPEKFWQGRGGIVSKICAHIPILTKNSDKRVLGVLEECSACIKSKVEYTGERRGGSGNHKPLIQTGSFYMQMVADCMEEGLGLHTTMNRVNKHRVAAGLLHVGLSIGPTLTFRRGIGSWRMPKINIWLLSGKAALNVRLHIYTLLYNPKNQLGCGRDRA